MTKPPPKTYALEDYEPFLNGRERLPNFEPIGDLAYVINALAAGGHSLKPVWGYALLEEPHKRWTQYFLTPPPGTTAGFDGGGYALVYGSNKPTVGRFAICKHEKVEGPGANHSRGWHPGWCGKCGMDMTVDSGD